MASSQNLRYISFLGTYLFGNGYHFTVVPLKGFSGVHRGTVGVLTHSHLSRVSWASEEAMLKYLSPHPSIIAWVLFNEGWGQAETKDESPPGSHFCESRPAGQRRPILVYFGDL